MNFTIAHTNLNVADMQKSLEFYAKALGLKEQRRKEAADGSFVIVFLADSAGRAMLELTWLADHPGAYDLGDNETHVAFMAEDYAAAHALHAEMGCICFENPQMGIYFINDPDGYWLEVIPQK